ncbi:poly(A) polymerase [Parasphingorhabdus marina DSM 22363]|uniref:Poly(A) polymerase n=1 Tax=Parasphingorhabdus marina DSM 22363 TaxID=1123272 RepID=A0A1N6CMC3_9SPHN|nr:CCA tRNA nucleotidyltransferase [Parasphingorhabdus marina]SIN59605.1 poly(A) polymerase [Parasphingorhabdus marina DSM 22363]
MKLPPASWHQRESLKNLVALLGGDQGDTRFVGGAVRDTLLGLPVSDVDLATTLTPEAVINRLKAAKIKVIPTGLAHGTVTAVTDDGPVEITTLRSDVSTDGRRATVAFTDDWKEDAARRDFTINALSADPVTLEVHDYFHGTRDLETRHVRFIGSATERIAEDHLRIMRYFRFLARFGNDAVDQDAFAACKQAAASLRSLSRERIADELMKLLATKNPVFAVGQMFQAGLFAHIFAETDGEAELLLARLIRRETEMDVSADPLRRLIALLPKDSDLSLKIVTLLRFSKKMRRAVTSRLSEPSPVPEAIPALAYHHGADAARDMALLFAQDSDLPASLALLENWTKPEFPIGGGDLVEMGLERGPIVAETLREIEQAWIEKGFPGDREAFELAKLMVRQASTR